MELELHFARKKHAKLNSSHEALSVIQEEILEFQNEVFRKRELRDPLKMLSELVQVAAMCARTAEDLGLVDVKGMELETLLYGRIAGAK